MIGEVHRRLDPHGPVGGGVLDHLVDQPPQVVERSQKMNGGDVQILEVGKRSVLGLLHWDGNPVAFGQFAEGGGTHRTFEVHMEMGLRKILQVELDVG